METYTVATTTQISYDAAVQLADQVKSAWDNGDISYVKGTYSQDAIATLRGTGGVESVTKAGGGADVPNPGKGPMLALLAGAYLAHRHFSQ